MSKLLTANLFRLIKSKAFWGGMIFMLIIGIAMPIMHYRSIQTEGAALHMDDGFFVSTVFIGIILSVFCSLFLGTEYSDGTIRNKVIAGQKRTVIYLSNLITCAASGILMCTVCFIAYLCVGIPLLGSFTAKAETILMFVLCVLVLTIVFSSIYTFIAMLNHNKTIVAVICIFCSFLFLFTGTYINLQLSEPEMYETYTESSESGEFIINEPQPNPSYVRGTKRQIYNFLYDFLPGGQALQIVNMSAEQPWLLLLYSGIITVAATGTGLLFFQRKNLK